MAVAQMVEVDSANLLKVGYDDEAGELHVVFRSSPTTTYVYADVPLDVFTRLLAAQSRGSWFAANVVGIYEFRVEAAT